MAGPEEGCPDKFAVCFDPESAAKLAQHLSELQRWSHEAWICHGESNE